MNLDELEREVLLLPQRDRANLASRLLGSLPGILAEDDDGIAEAFRRDAEMDRDPSASMTLDELKQALGR